MVTAVLLWAYNDTVMMKSYVDFSTVHTMHGWYRVCARRSIWERNNGDIRWL